MAFFSCTFPLSTFSVVCTACSARITLLKTDRRGHQNCQCAQEWQTLLNDWKYIHSVLEDRNKTYEACLLVDLLYLLCLVEDLGMGTNQLRIFCNKVFAPIPSVLLCIIERLPADVLAVALTHVLRAQGKGNM